MIISYSYYNQLVNPEQVQGSHSNAALTSVKKYCKPNHSIQIVVNFTG
jgi:hypothetical protein